MKKQKLFAGALGALMLFGIPACGQTSAALPPEEPAAQQNPAIGRIGEIILDGTASRLPVSASISTEAGTAAFEITGQTLFLDSAAGGRLPASDLLEARDACVYAEEAQPSRAEAVLLHVPEGAAPAHLHTVEEIAELENGLRITTDNGSLHLFVPEGAALSFYADGAAAPREALQTGDRVFAWYDGIEETYPGQASTDRLVIVPLLESLPETLPDGLSLSVLPGSVTPSGASFRLWHNTGAQIEFGSDYALQRLENGEWADVPFAIENGAFTMEAYSLPKGEPRTLEINWEWLYGTLAPGQYRLVKTVMDFHGTGDFEEYPLAAEFRVPGEYIICGENGCTVATLQ